MTRCRVTDARDLTRLPTTGGAHNHFSPDRFAHTGWGVDTTFGCVPASPC